MAVKVWTDDVLCSEQIMTTRVKEVRKTSNACDACKRRKGKCSGANPCTHCKDCGMECTYSLSNKKRGPVKKLKTSVCCFEIEHDVLTYLVERHRW